ncbi:hypothetical protein HF086_001170 [Spodoptera exigua]|uniref:Uncharacterized protein n=1 Tax=Spodoptera exigua TaxID=7107 RepID=A0A922SBP1_SPOEX|nr:hypothetical protein HF086_001170 [Spodoptera exigua]
MWKLVDAGGRLRGYLSWLARCSLWCWTVTPSTILATGQDFAGSHHRVPEDIQSQGATATDKIPWEGADEESVGSDGGGGEAGAVSARHVRRYIGRKPARGCL